MPSWMQTDPSFSSFDRRTIHANFAGGDVSSDGEKHAVAGGRSPDWPHQALDAALLDLRDPELITHRQIDLCCGSVTTGWPWVTKISISTLRRDLTFQTALERDTVISFDF